MIKRRSFGTHPRRDFSKIPPFIEVPYLLGIQTSSYDRFLQRGVPQSERENLGLEAVFHSVFPIQDFKGIAALEYVRYTIGEPKYSADECRERGMTLSAPLKVTIRLVLYQKDAAGKKTVKDMKEQEVYFGELPLMTPTGTFIINGTERVVVSQMHKSPGVFFDSEKSKTGPVVRTLYAARMIPYRGSWLDFEFDAKDYLYARIDRRRKFLATTFLQAMGFTRQEILDTFYRRETVTQAESGAFTKRLDPELHQGHKLRRGIVHPKTGEVLVKEGHKLTGALLKKLKASGVEEIPLAPEELAGQITAREIKDPATGEVLFESNVALGEGDVQTIREKGIRQFELLAIDGLHTTSHLRDTLEADGIRSTAEALVEIYKKMRPGEPPTLETSRVFFENLFFNPKRYDLSPVGRMKLTTKLSLQDKVGLDVRVLTRDDIIETLRRLIKINAGQGRPDDVDHLGNRRVKSIGELLENQFRIGLVRMERALKERMAVQEVETLMPHDLVNARPVDAAIKEFFGSSQLSQFMDQTNPLAEITHKRRLSALGPGGLTRERAGFEVRDVHPTHYGRVCPIETPEGPNIGLITSLSTFARVNEYGFIETPYRTVKDGKVTDQVRFLTADEEDRYVIAQANTSLDAAGKFTSQKVSARRSGEFELAPPEEIEMMDVSPKQIVSVATALIPFLEHDDANRALMGSNMQRQAVPLLVREAPLVGTGVEGIAARDSGVTITAPCDGVIEKVDANRIILRGEATPEDPSGRLEVFNLIKYRRSNQNTCVNQVPIVREGQVVKMGDPLADGSATDQGELALGRNVVVAFMPWHGYNFEDAIIVSERLVRDDVFTSVHIEEFEVEARDTKLGKEDITRDIPNVSEEALRNLDESGIVRIAAEIKPGDILVGKVTPKGETQLTPEEKLLRAIFGEKAGDVRDSSLVTPPGIEGTVVDVKVFSRRGTTKDERAAAIEAEEIAKIKREFADELALLRDEEARRLVGIFVGKPSPKRLTGRKSKKVVCKLGEMLTEEVLLEADLGPLLQPRVFKEEELREQIAKVHEQAEERAAVLKALCRRAHQPAQEGGRAAPRRHQARQGLRGDQAQDLGRRQDGRAPRQQGRRLDDRPLRGHALPAGRPAGRHRAQPARRAVAHERRAGPRDPPRLGRARPGRAAGAARGDALRPPSSRRGSSASSSASRTRARGRRRRSSRSSTSSTARSSWPSRARCATGSTPRRRSSTARRRPRSRRCSPRPASRPTARPCSTTGAPASRSTWRSPSAACTCSSCTTSSTTRSTRARSVPTAWSPSSRSAARRSSAASASARWRSGRSKPTARPTRCRRSSRSSPTTSSAGPRSTSRSSRAAISTRPGCRNRSTCS